MSAQAAKWVLCSWIVRFPLPISCRHSNKSKKGNPHLMQPYHHIHVIVGSKIDRVEILCMALETKFQLAIASPCWRWIFKCQSNNIYQALSSENVPRNFFISSISDSLMNFSKHSQLGSPKSKPGVNLLLIQNENWIVGCGTVSWLMSCAKNLSNSFHFTSRKLWRTSCDDSE